MSDPTLKKDFVNPVWGILKQFGDTIRTMAKICKNEEFLKYLEEKSEDLSKVATEMEENTYSNSENSSFEKGQPPRLK